MNRLGRSIGPNPYSYSAYLHMQYDRRLLPAHILLCVISGDAVGLQIAEYYCSARGVPTSNILTVAIAAPTNSPRITNANETILLTTLKAALDVKTAIKCITLCGHWYTEASTETANSSGNIQGLNLARLLNNPFALENGLMHMIAYTNFSEGPYLPICHKFVDQRYRAAGLLDAAKGTSLPIYDAVPAWEANPKVYNVGDQIRPPNLQTALGLYFYECTVAGTAGTVAPIIGYTAGESNTYGMNGTARWKNAFVASQRKLPAYPYNYRIPNNQYALLQAMGDDVYTGLDGAVKVLNWKRNLAYSVVYLDAPDPHASDPYNVSMFAIVKRMIDDAISTENERHKILPGNKYFQESATWLSQGTCYAEAIGRGVDPATCYHSNIDAFAASFPNALALNPAIDRMPAGCAALYPGYTGSWTNQTDVMYIGNANGAYWGTSKALTRSHYAYRKGAITMWGHSYGGRPMPAHSVDPQYEALNVLTTYNGTAKNAKNLRAAVYVRPGLATYSLFGVQYTGTSTAAQLQVMANNSFVLREDSGAGIVDIATITLTPSTTAVAMLDQVVAQLPAGWDCVFQDIFISSRVSEALRNGASVAMGVAMEPLGSTSNASCLMACLSEHSCIAEYALNYTSHVSQEAETMEAPALGPIIYGDPLYRPIPY